MLASAVPCCRLLPSSGAAERTHPCSPYALQRNFSSQVSAPPPLILQLSAYPWLPDALHCCHALYVAPRSPGVPHTRLQVPPEQIHLDMCLPKGSLEQPRRQHTTVSLATVDVAHSAYDACRGAHGLCLVTDWPEFRCGTRGLAHGTLAWATSSGCASISTPEFPSLVGSFPARCAGLREAQSIFAARPLLLPLPLLLVLLATR